MEADSEQKLLAECIASKWLPYGTSTLNKKYVPVSSISHVRTPPHSVRRFFRHWSSLGSTGKLNINMLSTTESLSIWSLIWGKKSCWPFRRKWSSTCFSLQWTTIFWSFHYRLYNHRSTLFKSCSSSIALLLRLHNIFVLCCEATYSLLYSRLLSARNSTHLICLRTTLTW